MRRSHERELPLSGSERPGGARAFFAPLCAIATRSVSVCPGELPAAGRRRCCVQCQQTFSRAAIWCWRWERVRGQVPRFLPIYAVRVRLQAAERPKAMAACWLGLWRGGWPLAEQKPAQGVQSALRFSDEANLAQTGLLSRSHGLRHALITHGLVATDMQVGLRILRCSSFQARR